MAKSKSQTENDKKIKEFIKFLEKNNYRITDKKDNIKTCSMQLSDKCKKDHEEKGGRKETEFYVTINDKLFKNPKVHICKDCIKEYCYKSNGDVDLVNFKKILQLLDIPFYKTDYETAINSKRDTFGIYHKSIALNHIGESWEDGEIEEFEDIQEKSIKTEEDLISFWGRGFSDEDYLWLQNEFNDWINRYECDSKGMELLIKQICLQELDIEQRRGKGEKVDQQLKTLQDLLGSSNLKPVQETGANSTEQASFGTLVKMYENEKPVPKPLPEWMKADWIRKYVVVWFLGHLCKMLGIENDYSKEYEEEIAKYTVNPPSEEYDNEEDI